MMKNAPIRSILKSITLVLLALSALSCQGPFTLNAALGLGMEGLSVSPDGVTILVSSTQDFTVSGGTAPYTWEVYSGLGDFLSPTGAATETYTAAATAGLVTVRVTDAEGIFGEASIAVNDSLAPLTILAGKTTIAAGDTLTFYASGGDGNYTYSPAAPFPSGGSITAGGLYTAGPTGAVDTIQVTDGLLNTDTVNITVSATALNMLVGTTTVTEGNSMTLYPVGGDGSYTFVIEDDPDATGSTVTSPGGLFTAGTTGGSSTVTVRLEDGLGAFVTQNITVQAVATVAPVVDYTINPATITAPTAVNGAFSAEFTYTNNGTDAGGAMEWDAYFSTTPGLAGVVSHAASGTDAAGLAGGATLATPVNVVGNGPTLSGSYYLIIHISSGSADTDTSNNTYVSGAYDLTVNYQVSTPPAGASVTSGDAVNVTFPVENSGFVNGAGNVFWTAYMSNDAALGSGDIELADGDFTALAAGAPAQNVTVNTGNWPSVSTAENRYLILEWYSMDDPSDVRTSASGAFSVNPLSINVNGAWSAVPALGTAGTAFSIDFSFTNDGSDTITAPGTYTCYLSTDGAIGVGDIKVSEGSFNLLGPSAVQNVTVSGTWPEDETTRFLIMEWENSEDVASTYKSVSSAGVVLSLPDADYVISDLQAAGSFYTGGSFNGQLSIFNNGTENALAGDVWDWEVYVSLDNSPSILSGDVKVAEGFNAAALDTGVVNEVTFSPLAASWPMDDGDYYLKARILNTREPAANLGNNVFVTATPYSVPNASDYEMVSMTVPVEMDAFGGFTAGSFQYRDGASVTNTEPVYWKVYASGDRVLDADTTATPGDDYLVFEGVVTTPPSAGGSDTVNFGTGAPLNDIGIFGKGVYPYVGNLYLIAVISSSTDNDSSDNVIVSSSIDILEGNSTFPDLLPNTFSGPMDSLGLTLAAPDADPNNSAQVAEINLGDEVTIRGFSDAVTEADTYHIVIGPGVENLYIRATWAVNHDYDIYLWDDPYSGYFALDSIGNGAEPFDSFVSIIPVAGVSDWYLMMYFYTFTPPGGGEYILTLTATGP